ncbi:metalloendoproteinase 5-MMP [Populus alba]|uniref:Peptidase metallopeptidase domain-containing protein n=2 Tax=Populus TaxID=3689 RepID=A0A4U5PT87_POPAL|nr:metalloendoproteinase 5-MMP-like [Populus alba]KAJ6986735.1 metalloendoproteinase 5-MMP-like [Populus alba x Populus x berolinensis]TKR99891.1 hypothetical protein D5086_0000188950 [Populus alba]
MSTMTARSFPIFVAILLLVAMQSRTIQSKPSGDPFGFIKHLEGCHKNESVKGLQELKRYLEKFGYLNYGHQGKKGHDHANDDEFDDLLESAVKAYQQNHHLNVTGSLDNSTVHEMMQPRCGVPDVVNGTKHYHTHKSIHTLAHYNFIPGNPRWTKRQLTYTFRSSVQVPAAQNIRSICAKAFQRWAQVTEFTFQEVTGSSPADIVIGFHRGDHNDGSAFDGPQGVLAHATSPARNAIFHFDAEENWSENPGPNQMDLESVAVHEIGHLLGLDHNDDPNADAIMSSRISFGITKRDLRADDIQGVRALYGFAN